MSVGEYCHNRTPVCNTQHRYPRSIFFIFKMLKISSGDLNSLVHDLLYYWKMFNAHNPTLMLLPDSCASFNALSTIHLYKSS